MKKLADEIKQRRPFESLEAEALLNLQRTADQMRWRMQRALKEHGLTAPQYNALRILRGAEPVGLRCSEVAERMISHDPDITRLLGRLERLRLTERHRDLRDRRVVVTRITKAGLLELKELDPIVAREGRRILQHMLPEKLTMLIDLLEEVRHDPG